MTTAAKSTLGALGLTILFFGLAALFMKFGPLGPSTGSAAAFLTILLPAILLLGAIGGTAPILVWSVIVLWVYFLSWIACALVLWLVVLVRNRGRSKAG